MRQKISKKYEHIKVDSSEYLKDLVFYRKDRLAFKTAAFIKRNFLRGCDAASFIENKTYKVWVAIKHALVHMVRGLKALGRDGIWAAKASTAHTKYNVADYQETKKLREVRRDYLKFIPFSLFLIIPGAELLLPAWIMVFPNSIPS